MIKKIRPSDVRSFYEKIGDVQVAVWYNDNLIIKVHMLSGRHEGWYDLYGYRDARHGSVRNEFCLKVEEYDIVALREQCENIIAQIQGHSLICALEGLKREMEGYDETRL